VAALALGILLAGAGAPAVVDAFGGGRGGYVVMAVFVALLLALGDSVGLGGVIALVVLVGVGYAGMQMFPLAMLPDVIAADEAASGQRRAGVFTGVWTAAETLGLAVGPGILGGLLAVAGYVSSTGEDVAQSSSAVLAVRLGFSLVPAVFVLASIPVLARYRLVPAR
jgi:Na+/melibiose symporter-like transporter